jgi:hAT family C-terminal dimerisation region
MGLQALYNTKFFYGRVFTDFFVGHHDIAFRRNKTYTFHANTLNNVEKHLEEVHILDQGGDIWRKRRELASTQASGPVDGSYERIIPFQQDAFKAALCKLVILDRIKYKKITSGRFAALINITNSQAVPAIPSSHSTLASWIHDMYWHFEPAIIAEIRTAKSRIHVSFDGWGSKHEKLSVLGVVVQLVHFINQSYNNVTRLIALPELPGHSKTGVCMYIDLFYNIFCFTDFLLIAQASVLLPALMHFGIKNDNLGYFVLDNATNNDTTLIELAKSIDFDPLERRLRCMGHILNLIAEQYLFGQDAASFEKDFKAAGAQGRRQLWRQRGALGKLHNLVAHIIASGKRSDLFKALQVDENIGGAEGRSLKLVLDGGIRWNASFSMILRALLLRDALDTYAFKLKVSKDELDRETFDNDYLDDDEWETLDLIKQHLEVLFRATKSLEGNTKLKEGARKASHGALWELLPVFEHILKHFEDLQTRASSGEFNGNPRIQSSITLAWNKTVEYYKKTDASIAWMAAVVLHPRFKWRYFEDNWKGSQKAFVTSGKAKFKKLWEDEYKSDDLVRLSRSPEPSPEPSFLESILDTVAPSTSGPIRASSRQDQLAQYIMEGPIGTLGVMEYWRLREAQWPQLAAMAFDFLSIPAMSSECERVFSSCGLSTTPHASKLSGESLAHEECLSNWSRQGAVKLERAWGAPVLH